MKILSVFGTRPEAIKLAPVVLACAADPTIAHRTCITGQHREMLDPILDLFGIVPEHDLAIMRPGQTLDHIVAATLHGVGALIADWRPDWVIVQGDTSSAFAAGLAAFHAKVPVAHVEAGLRTGNLMSPWPEEANRRLLGQLATLHFPPTPRAADNLRSEGVSEAKLLMTGNTVIDALQLAVKRIDADPVRAAALANDLPSFDPAKRLILVTGHRRENLDGGLAAMCEALKATAQRGDVEIVYPVHLNPKVQATARAILGNHPAVHLLGPRDYPAFVQLMRQAYLIVTDSGGIQEEATALGIPVLVARDTTERPEAIEAGTARLVPPTAANLTSAIAALLDNPASHAQMAQAASPFGDGRACARIVAHLIEAHKKASL
jgi:UDP-N-acetylglucosamine 2-epimerase